jgi:hypothetical protein
MEGLSGPEREAALSVLEDFMRDGASPIIEYASRDLYRVPPVSMKEFLENPFYLGSITKTLFPEIKKDLIEIFEGGYNTAIWGGSLGGGKKQRVKDHVLTPTGFRQIVDLKVGDQICNPDGTIAIIRELHAITQEQEYIFELGDGEEVSSCGDHLWYGGWRRDKSDPCLSWNNSNCIKTSRQVYDHTLREFSKKLGSKKLFKIPITEAVDLTDIGGRTIDPYLLGYMLGNGTMNDRRVKITVNGADIHFYREIADRVGSNYVTDFSKYGKDCFDISFKGDSVHKLRLQLRTIGLFNADAGSKFVPECYKFAPKVARLAILQGLLDSDGSADKECGSVKFFSTNERLARDVQWLARSLGCYASLSKRAGRDRTSGDGSKTYECSDSFTVYIRSRNNKNLFRLARKKVNALGETTQLYNTVRNVRLGEVVPMRCITVSNPNGLYLTDNFLVTHNSTGSVIGCVRMAYDVYCMRDPHETYQISSTDYISVPCVSVTEDVAERNLVSKIRAIVDESEFFRKHFAPIRNTAAAGIIFPNRFTFPPGASTAGQVVGTNAIGAAVDEGNFFHKRDQQVGRSEVKENIEVIFEAIKRRMESRFMNRGRLPGVILVASSKTTPNAFTEKLIRKYVGDPLVFVRERAVWEAVPKERFSGKKFRVAIGNETKMSRIMTAGEADPEGMEVVEVPVEFHGAFVEDIDAAIRDHAGRSTVAITPFIARREKIYEAIDKNRTHPFSQETWDQDIPGRFDWQKLAKLHPDGSWEPLAHPKAPRHLHLDLSKTQDCTGIAVGCVAGYAPIQRFGKAEQEMAPIIHVDFVLQVRAPRGGEISYSEIRRIIYELTQHGFFIKQVSADQFQSANLLQTVKGQGYQTRVVSVEPAGGPYEVMKTALYENRIQIYNYPPLIKELRELQKDWKTGKVDHPPATQRGSKDIADALAAITTTLTEAASGILDVPISSREMFQNSDEDTWVLDDAATIVIESNSEEMKQEWRANAEKALEQEANQGHDWKSNFTPPFLMG